MKTTTINPIWLALLFLSPALLSAQSFSVDWFTIDGGGGTSSGGSFTLSGTIGQPDAGTLSGGSFSLMGGFWAGASVVIKTNPPQLSIERSASGTVIAWAPATPGFVLQVSESLAPGAWSDAPSGNTNPVTLPPAQGARYYRLRKP